MTSKSRVISGLISAFLLAAATSHAAPLPGFRLAAQSEHFSFYVKGKRKVNPKKSERFLAKVERMLGADVDGHGAYYRHEDPQGVEYATGLYRDGATKLSTGEIHSTKEYHPHEIVHFALSQIGKPGLFFHEGLAVMIAEEGKLNGKKVDKLAKPFVDRVPFATFVNSFAQLDPNISYAVAASFTKSLIESHGMAQVVEFVRRCDGPQGDRDYEFARVFGQTLEQAGITWAARLSGAEPSSHQGTLVATSGRMPHDSPALQRTGQPPQQVVGAIASRGASLDSDVASAR